LKWMKRMSEGKGKTNDSPFVITVFGILCRNGPVWAEVVVDVEADTLPPRISGKVSTRSPVCSDTGKDYTGIAARGEIHRLVNHGGKPVE
jgi:hypothetical protein